MAGVPHDFLVAFLRNSRKSTLVDSYFCRFGAFPKDETRRTVDMDSVLSSWATFWPWMTMTVPWRSSFNEDSLKSLCHAHARPFGSGLGIMTANNIALYSRSIESCSICLIPPLTFDVTHIGMFGNITCESFRICIIFLPICMSSLRHFSKIVVTTDMKMQSYTASKQ